VRLSKCKRPGASRSTGRRGAKTERPELAKLLRALEPGDVLIVTRLDRLARSTRDLLNVLDAVAKAKAGFRPLARAELQDIELAVVRQG
jgi:DNA invertase Pin-like site-specific DNA recombinase